MGKLYSGDELRREVKNLIASSSREVVLISAFIKSSILEEFSEVLRHREVSVYVRWKLIDILREVSDFKSLYDFCNQKGFKLYYNQDLHAKALIIDQNYALIGSSNYTQSGLGGGYENIEWNTGIHHLSTQDFNRIMSSLKNSDLVTPLVFDNFSLALESMNYDFDFEEIESVTPDLSDVATEYYPTYRQKLPPFDSRTFNFELSEHKEYIQSLGFIRSPNFESLVKAIKNSFYGQIVLDKLHSQPVLNNREKRLRWGDLGYTDFEFYSKNDGLYNLLNWLSFIDDKYTFYVNPNYPKGTCSLNYLVV